MRKLWRKGEGGRQFRAASPVASYLSTRFAVSEGVGLREEGEFSAPLKYGITLEIIARHWRSMLGGGNLISR